MDAPQQYKGSGDQQDRCMPAVNKPQTKLTGIPGYLLHRPTPSPIPSACMFQCSMLCFALLGFAWPTNGAELADEAAAAARPDEAVALAWDGVAVDAVGVCLSRKLRRNDSAAGYVSPAKQDQHPPARHCPGPPRHQRHQRHRPGPGVST